MNANLFARLAGGFPEDRRRAALITETGTSVSFGDLLELTGCFVALLRASGVQPGDRVVVQVEKSVPAVSLYLSVLQTGAVFVPLDPAAPAEEVIDLIGQCDPRAVVCAPTDAPALAAPVARGGACLFTLDGFGQGSLEAQASALASDRSVAERTGEDLATILFVRIPPGTVQGAMLSHDNLWSNAATLHWHWGYRSGDIVLHTLGLHEFNGLFASLNPVLMNGGAAILLPRFEAQLVAARLSGSTVMIGSGEQFAELAANDLSDWGALETRLLVCADGALPEAVRAEFAARTGKQVHAQFALPETGAIASTGLHEAPHQGSAGQALPGSELRVRTAAGIAAAGVLGNLEARGPGVFCGYWKQPADTAEAFTEDGFFKSNLQAKLDGDGFLTFAGTSSRREPATPSHATTGFESEIPTVAPKLAQA